MYIQHKVIYNKHRNKNKNKVMTLRQMFALQL